MTPSEPTMNLGPLPGSDRNAELQQLSINALNSALPVDRFVFRREGDIDAGVDGTIELRYNSVYTNLRAQVQMKGSYSSDLNQDGSFSLKVDVSNLNYLLNGFSPIYIVYIVSRTELRYLWAHDERKRAEDTHSDWMNQKQITLRFANILTPDALGEIYERVLREGRFQRSFHETLSRSLPTNQVIIGVNPDTLDHTDPVQLKDILEKGGIALVSSGYADEVLESINLLNPQDADSAYFQLIRAYAEYMLAKYDHALGATKKALLKRGDLSTENQSFLQLLKHNCDLQTGRITIEEYERNREAWQQQLPYEYALGQRLEYLRHAILGEADFEARIELTGKLDTLVRQILAEPRISEPSKFQAHLTNLYAQGQMLCFQFMRAISNIRIRAKIRAFRNPQQALQQLLTLHQLWVDWLRAMRLAIQQAMEQQYPILFADALVYYATVVDVYLSDCHIASVTAPLPVSPAEELSVDAQRFVKRAIDIYEKAGHIEGETRAKLTLIELLHLEGKRQEALEVAQEIYPKAEIMGYTRLARQLKDYAEGRSALDETLERTRNATAEDNDAIVSQHSDEQMREAARLTKIALGLPDSRLPIVERGMLAMRDIARERMNWCRHIEILEDLSHTRSQETYCLVDPNRHCFCQKHKYESAIGNPDWKVIISAFKQVHCMNCEDRSPKNQDSSTNG